MSAVILEERAVIPDAVVGHDAYRRWARSVDFPQTGRFAYLAGKIWVDMSPEDLFTHNQIKNECAVAITTLLKRIRLGRFFGDRTLLSHRRAGLSTEPDGLFISWDGFRKRRVKLVRGRRRYIEIQGSPDMTLEVVSDSSITKDTVTLRKLYWKAGVREYWLINALEGELQFDILQHTKSGYVAARKRAGWVESKVFGKSFKLTSKPDELGFPEYTLSFR
jgi:Uma2 family endonuclease